MTITKTELLRLQQRAEYASLAARQVNDQVKYRRMMDLADAAEAAARVIA